MGVRQPGVQREHRQLDAETDEEAQITEQAKGAPRGAGRQFRQVEGEMVAGEGQGQAAEQDQQRGGGGVKNELGGGVLALAASPDRNQ